MHGAQKVLSNNGFRMANCFCLSQNAMVCLAHFRQELHQKSWKICNTFSSRLRPRPNVQDQDQDFMIQDQDFHFFVLEAPRDQDPGLEDYITAINTIAVNRDYAVRPT